MVCFTSVGKNCKILHVILSNATRVFFLSSRLWVNLSWVMFPPQYPLFCRFTDEKLFLMDKRRIPFSLFVLYSLKTKLFFVYYTFVLYYFWDRSSLINQHWLCSLILILWIWGSGQWSRIMRELNILQSPHIHLSITLGNKSQPMGPEMVTNPFLKYVIEHFQCVCKLIR